MDDNVFAPGSAGGSGGNPAAHASPYEFSDRSFNDVIGLLSRTWELLIKNIGTLGIGIAILFGIQIISQVLNFAISFGAETIDDEATKAIVSLSAQLPALFFGLVQLYFQVGLIKLSIELDRGNDVELDALWSQGGAFIQVVVASMVIGVAYFVVLMFATGVSFGIGWGAAMALGWETGLLVGLGIGGLIFTVVLIGVIIIGLGLQLYIHSIVDQRANFIESLPFSWDLTDGWKLFLFLQHLVNFVLTIVALCVTLCFASPVVTGVLMVLGAVTYNAILHDADATGRLAR